MIPAFPLQRWAEGVHPEAKRGRDGEGMIAELIVGTEAEPLLELRVAAGTALVQYAIQGALQTTGCRAVIRSPITEPNRPPIVPIHRGDNQVHAVLDVVVTGDCARKEQIRLQVSRVVLDEIR